MTNKLHTGSNYMSKPSSRIEYIDALRGMTMIFVVFNHIATFVWDITDTGIPSVHNYLVQVRMPMFFFISGFVLYKGNVIWNRKYVFEFLRKKILIQIIPTLVFLTLFVHVHGGDLLSILYTPAKCGYWFTYMLFLYFFLYAIIQFCFRKHASLIMLIIGIAFLPIAYPPITNIIPISDSSKGLLSIVYFHYFLFFFIGSIARKHFVKIEYYLESKYLLFFCIIIYFVLNVYHDIVPNNGHGPTGFIVGLFLTFSGLTILFAFFRSHREQFSKSCFLGRSLQYIGRRTLDVYLLHYFFIPYQLGRVISVFKEHPMPIIEALFSLALALVVIACTLLISNIIRLSPILAHYLFGVKYCKK